MKAGKIQAQPKSYGELGQNLIDGLQVLARIIAEKYRRDKYSYPARMHRADSTDFSLEDTRRGQVQIGLHAIDTDLLPPSKSTEPGGSLGGGLNR